MKHKLPVAKLFINRVKEAEQCRFILSCEDCGLSIPITNIDPKECYGFRCSCGGNGEISQKVENQPPSDKLKLALALEAAIKALEFYGEKAAWAEFVSSGNIFGEQQGDHMMAFDKGDDSPWEIAQNAEQEIAEILQQ